MERWGILKGGRHLHWQHFVLNAKFMKRPGPITPLLYVCMCVRVWTRVFVCSSVTSMHVVFNCFDAKILIQIKYL